MTGDHDATAHVVLGRTRDVERLLEAPDPVVEHVLDDSRLRRALAEATVRQRRGAWRETVVDRGRLREEAWLDRWWLPACSTAELRLLATVTFHTTGIASGSVDVTHPLRWRQPSCCSTCSSELIASTGGT